MVIREDGEIHDQELTLHEQIQHQHEQLALREQLEELRRENEQLREKQRESVNESDRRSSADSAKLISQLTQGGDH